MTVNSRASVVRDCRLGAQIMKPRLTRAEARAYVARWQRVNAAEIQELRRTPMAVKLRQLAAMMATARALGWTEALAEGEAEVWERWNRLRKAYRG
jgi:hypothetical protein